MAKQVAIHDLKPGMFIVGVIEQNGPVKIRKSGLVTSNEMVQGLAEMGVLAVAIDPEKTVEIELEDTVHVSQTQFVMQANEEKASRDTDTHLSEQFNRSLFMPSLQQVPSAWQYYGVKAATAFLVVVLGFASGWYGSKVPSILAGETRPSQKSDEPATEETGKTATTDNQTKDNPTKDNTINHSPTTLATTAEDVAEPAVAGTTPQADDGTVSEAVDDSSTNPDPAADIVSSSAKNSENNSQIATNSTDTKDMDPADQSPQNSAVNQVSPELLQRFEQAMADLERESSPEADGADFADDGETLNYGNPDNRFNSTDVQRVDQLPARVMTRLPRMSFSAHMYASNPRDRWVKVNGVEMGEGEWLDDKVFIEKIEPQHVILLFEGHQFSMRALSEW